MCILPQHTATHTLFCLSTVRHTHCFSSAQCDTHTLFCLSTVRHTHTVLPQHSATHTVLPRHSATHTQFCPNKCLAAFACWSSLQELENGDILIKQLTTGGYDMLNFTLTCSRDIMPSTPLNVGVHFHTFNPSTVAGCFAVHTR